MRYKMLAVSILAATLSAFVIVAAAQRSPQNSQNQTTQDQSNPAAPGYTWRGGCGPGMMGYGMMGPGGYGMMGPGMMGYGGYGMMGSGMMGYGYGPGMMGWGNRQQGSLNLSTSDVKGDVERWITTMGNPRLKAGPITEKDANTITADIVTADKDVLVQRFRIDRHTGFWQPQPVN